MLNRMKIATLAATAAAAAIAEATGLRSAPWTSTAPRSTSRDSWENTPDLRSLRGPLTKYDHERIAKARAKRQRKAEARLRRL